MDTNTQPWCLVLQESDTDILFLRLQRGTGDCGDGRFRDIVEPDIQNGDIMFEITLSAEDCYVYDYTETFMEAPKWPTGYKVRALSRNGALARLATLMAECAAGIHD